MADSTPEPLGPRGRRRLAVSARLGLWIAVVACLLLVPAQALGGDKEEALKHFKAGVSLQKVEDFEAAIAAFESSLRLYASKGALFNLANCQRATHRYGEALATLERLDREFGDRLDRAMRAAVDRQLEELRNLTAELVVEVEQTGAEVRVDGKVIGQTPLTEELRLSPGRHEIEVRLEGFEPAKVQVELVPGEKTVQPITLEKSAPPAPPEPPPPPKPEPDPAPPPPDAGPGALGVTGWVAGVVGVAALASGAATGAWALSLDGDLADACPDESCPADRTEDIDQLNTLTTTTNVLLIVGGSLTAAGLVMLLVDPGGSAEEDGATVGLSFGPDLLGATLRGRF